MNFYRAQVDDVYLNIEWYQIVTVIYWKILYCEFQEKFLLVYMLDSLEFIVYHLYVCRTNLN